MNKINYANDAKSAFDFLISKFDFKLINDEHLQFGHVLEYQRNEIKIHLYFEYRDPFFYFYIINGSNTKFPNDQDNENIKIFNDIVDKYQLSIDCKNLQPNDEEYLTALKLNAEILKNNCSDILNGKDWFS